MIEYINWEAPNTPSDYILIGKMQSDTHKIIIKQEKVNKKHLNLFSYTAYLVVEKEFFIIPHTEFLKCINIDKCKLICQNYWTVFFTQRIMRPKNTILPPTKIMSQNAK